MIYSIVSYHLCHTRSVFQFSIYFSPCNPFLSLIFFFSKHDVKSSQYLVIALWSMHQSLWTIWCSNWTPFSWLWRSLSGKMTYMHLCLCYQEKKKEVYSQSSSSFWQLLPWQSLLSVLPPVSSICWQDSLSVSTFVFYPRWLSFTFSLTKPFMKSWVPLLHL